MRMFLRRASKPKKGKARKNRAKEEKITISSDVLHIFFEKGTLLGPIDAPKNGLDLALLANSKHRSV